VKLRHVAPIACIALALVVGAVESGCTKQQTRAVSDISKTVACAVARAELPDSEIVEQCSALWGEISDAVLSARRKLAAARQEERARAMAARCVDGGAP